MAGSTRTCDHCGRRGCLESRGLWACPTGAPRMFFCDLNACQIIGQGEQACIRAPDLAPEIREAARNKAKGLVAA